MVVLSSITHIILELLSLPMIRKDWDGEGFCKWALKSGPCKVALSCGRALLAESCPLIATVRLGCPLQAYAKAA